MYLTMATRPKENTNKLRRANRRFAMKSDKFSNSKQNEILDEQLIVKRRGLYVESNPEELVINEVNDKQLRNGKMSSQRSSQRGITSSVITSSIVGNRNIITHEVATTKRGSRCRNISSRAKNSDVDNNPTNQITPVSKNGKRKSRNLNKEHNNYDDIVYVLPYRNNKNLSLTNSDSLKSKTVDLKESSTSIKNYDILSESFCKAAEVLEGWMKRKEKKSTEVETPIDKVDEGLYNLCVDLVECTLDGDDYKINHVNPSSSKQRDTVTKPVPKKLTFENSDYQNISETDFNINDKFYIAETNNAPTFNKLSEPLTKSKRVLLKDNIKSRSLTYASIQNKSSPHSQSFNNTDYKRNKKNCKKKFIDTIKRELETYDRKIEEPCAMFDALKIMARNKGTKKHISFNGGVDKQTERRTDVADCEYNSPRLIVTGNFNRNKWINKRKPSHSQIRSKLIRSKGHRFLKQQFSGAHLLVQNFNEAPDKKIHVITM